MFISGCGIGAYPIAPLIPRVYPMALGAGCFPGVIPFGRLC